MGSGPGQGQTYWGVFAHCPDKYALSITGIYNKQKRLTNWGESPLEHCIKTSPSKHLPVRRHQHSLCIVHFAFIDTAMLMSTLWSAFGSLMGLFYAGMQVMVPCLPPAPLSISRLNTDEVRGFKVIVFIHTLHVSITV